MFLHVVCLCRLRPRRQEKIEKQYCMSLRTAMIVSCYEDKRKFKSNIVCLCGLQWLCLLSVGDLQVNVASGRMSLRTAATKTRENVKAILYVFADCNGCVC